MKAPMADLANRKYFKDTAKRLHDTVISDILQRQLNVPPMVFIGEILDDGTVTMSSHLYETADTMQQLAKLYVKRIVDENCYPFCIIMIAEAWGKRLGRNAKMPPKSLTTKQGKPKKNVGELLVFSGMTADAAEKYLKVYTIVRNDDATIADLVAMPVPTADNNLHILERFYVSLYDYGQFKFRKKLIDSL